MLSPTFNLPTNEADDDRRAVVLIDSVEPSVRKSNTDNADEILAKDLRLSEDDIVTASITLHFRTEPTAVKPKTLMAEPDRM
jgi:hypothetical protein